MKKPSPAMILLFAVSLAFAVLIAAWCVLFWIASENRVQDIPLETAAETGIGTTALETTVETATVIETTAEATALETITAAGSAP